MNTLFIDTSSNKEIIVGLEISGKKFEQRQQLLQQKAQVLLPVIDAMLKKHDLHLTDLSGIVVDVGPGSFTGLRVGISVANTLGASLQIPINNQSVGVLVEPRYT